MAVVVTFSEYGIVYDKSGCGFSKILMSKLRQSTVYCLFQGGLLQRGQTRGHSPTQWTDTVWKGRVMHCYALHSALLCHIIANSKAGCC